MIDDGIYELVMQNAAAIGLTGGLHPGTAPKEPTYPLGTYQNVGARSWPTFATSGLQQERWQFDFFAETSKAAANLFWAFRTFFEGYQGVLPDGTYLQNAIYISRDGPKFEDASLNYHVMTEFYLQFTL